MTIETKRDTDILNVIIRGRIDSETTPELENCLAEYAAGYNNIKFDISEVDFVSSKGIRVFVAYYKKVSINGGKIIFSGANSAVKEIFKLSGIMKFFEFE